LVCLKTTGFHLESAVLAAAARAGFAGMTVVPAGAGFLEGAAAMGRVMRSEQHQLLRNSGDLLLQGSKVLRVRGQGSSGVLKKAIDILEKRGNGRSLLGGRSCDSGSEGGGTTCSKVVDFLGHSCNSLNQLGVGGIDGGGGGWWSGVIEVGAHQVAHGVDLLRHVFEAGFERDPVSRYKFDALNGAFQRFIHGVESDELLPERELNLIEAVGDGSVISGRGAATASCAAGVFCGLGVSWPDRFGAGFLV
jgi:hypothetical protein